MRQIIVLETNPADGGSFAIRAAFWFSVPAGKQIAQPNFASAVRAPAAPLTQELTDLQSGAVVEEVRDFAFPASATATAIKASLVSAYVDRKAYRDAQPFVGQYYGVSWDGAAWSV